MIKINITQGSDAWHDERRGRFTGIRMKGLQSKKTTASYQDSIMDVVGEILSGETEENYVNADMQRGTDLEPFARGEYEELYGIEVEEVGFCLPDDELLAEWVGISPDGILPDSGLIEIKCPKLKTHLKYLEANRVPNEYKWQVQSQLWVTGAPYCDFMSYYPGMKPFIIRVEPDPVMFEAIDMEVRIAIQAVKDKIELYKQYKAEDEL